MKILKWKLARLRVRYRLNPNRLWIRYLIGLFIIFALIFVSHKSSLSVINTGKRDAYLIKLSGQQSVLSQQILMTAAKYRSRPIEENREDLARLVNKFNSAHDVLIYHVDMSKELQFLYLNEDRLNSLDADSRKFVNKLELMVELPPSDRKSIDAFHYINNFAPVFLLEKLNKAVVIFEESAQKNVDELTFVQNISVLLSAVILVLEFLFIFLPTQRSVTRSIRRLERHKRSLRRARKNLAGKNEQLNQSYERMEHAAMHDSLTGLANRRNLEKELGARIRRYSYEDGEMAALHIDLDNFKIINDTLGHSAGDHILKEAAKIFRSNARGSDFVSRIGGDEFVIITDNKIGNKSVSNIAQRIIDAFNQPIEFNGEMLNVSSSIGIDIFNPKDKVGTNCVSEILTNSDVALYLAKHNGRNRYEFFSNSYYQKFLKLNALKSD